jgi:4-diphosphocytidyl-2-C-methyl-D-erythritol kinase
MNVHPLAAGAMVRAPAKLNAFFEVLARRGDGFHEIETLMLPISLYDTLVAHPSSDGRVHVECRWASPRLAAAFGPLPTSENNLAAKAAERLRARAGLRDGIRIELIKRIPAQAGLGGGSSDAAAALLAANVVWKLDWNRESLAEIGAELGSDVPFFLSRAEKCGYPAAVCRGRGEQVVTLDSRTPFHFVVVYPPVGLSTAQVYQRCQVPREPKSVVSMAAALMGGDAGRATRLAHNRLESAAESLSPWVARLQREFAREDCLAAQMSGSGSSYFGFCRHARHAQRVARRLRSRGLGQVYVVSTSN